ncbi:hypothetical protein BGX27_003847, partial [Mortierella sp. AM989]
MAIRYITTAPTAPTPIALHLDPFDPLQAPEVIPLAPLTRTLVHNSPYLTRD